MANKLNSSIRVNARHNFNINVNHGDNYISVKGNGPDGHVDEAIMESDDKCQEKVQALIEKLASHQLSEIQNFADNAANNFQEQLSDMNEDIADYFN